MSFYCLMCKTFVRLADIFLSLSLSLFICVCVFVCVCVLAFTSTQKQLAYFITYFTAHINFIVNSFKLPFVAHFEIAGN